MMVSEQVASRHALLASAAWFVQRNCVSPHDQNDWNAWVSERARTQETTHPGEAWVTRRLMQAARAGAANGPIGVTADFVAALLADPPAASRGGLEESERLLFLGLTRHWAHATSQKTTHLSDAREALRLCLTALDPPTPEAAAREWALTVTRTLCDALVETERTERFAEGMEIPSCLWDGTGAPTRATSLAWRLLEKGGVLVSRSHTGALRQLLQEAGPPDSPLLSRVSPVQWLQRLDAVSLAGPVEWDMVDSTGWGLREHALDRLHRWKAQRDPGTRWPPAETAWLPRLQARLAAQGFEKTLRPEPNRRRPRV